MSTLHEGFDRLVDAFAPAAEVIQAHRDHQEHRNEPVDKCRTLEDPTEYEKALISMHDKFPHITSSDEFLEVCEKVEAGEISEKQGIDTFTLVALVNVLYENEITNGNI